MSYRGVWLPIITPFLNDEVDYDSFESLINHYIPTGITGIIPNATTGECPSIDESEEEQLLRRSIEITDNRCKVFWGAGGNNTKKAVNKVKALNNSGIDGVLSVCPYYNRPSQEGIYEHFLRISEVSDKPIIIYNIPYRTGINMTNETILHLAELKNIMGIKDSCGDISQTLELLRYSSDDFHVFTGEDILFYMNAVSGGDGGILASAHLYTNEFIMIWKLIQENNHEKALTLWNELSKFIPWLFKSTNPGPLKYLLQKQGLIKSDELRLPLTQPTRNYKNILDSISK